jgi:cell division septation protein DedD
MNNQIKQRIIGIIVLAAFIAILVPFLFSGSKKTTMKATTLEVSTTAINVSEANKLIEQKVVAASQNSPHTPSETNKTKTANAAVIHEQRPSATTVPVQTSQTAINSVTLSSPKTNGLDNQEVSSETDSQKTEISQTKSLQFDATTTPEESSIVTSKKQKPMLMAKQHIVKSKIAKKAKTKLTKSIRVQKTVLPKNPRWAVQLGCFVETKSAENLLSDLRSKGFRPYTKKTNGKKINFTCVLVGNEADQIKASKIANTLEQLFNLKGKVIEE